MSHNCKSTQKGGEEERGGPWPSSSESAATVAEKIQDEFCWMEWAIKTKYRRGKEGGRGQQQQRQGVLKGKINRKEGAKKNGVGRGRQRGGLGTEENWCWGAVIHTPVSFWGFSHMFGRKSMKEWWRRGLTVSSPSLSLLVKGKDPWSSTRWLFLSPGASYLQEAGAAGLGVEGFWPHAP